jgi:hypothetical protein
MNPVKAFSVSAILMAGSLCISIAHAADTTAKAGLHKAVDAAQKWQRDAALTNVSTWQANPDGTAPKWSYMFHSPKAKMAYSVDVKGDKVVQTMEVRPHITDPVGDFVDSDKAMQEAKKNGIKGKPAMSLIVMGQATKNPGVFWSVVSSGASSMLSVVIEGRSGKFSYKQETKL